jgi:hydrogenase expression/formation protein HypC
MCLGIPGEVLEVGMRDGLRFGRVRFGGIVRSVCFEYQPTAAPGDFVLVHVGFAIAKLDRAEAARAWEMLEQIGQTEEVAAQAADPAEGST